MSYEYRTKPPAKDGSFSASFFPLVAELSASTVKSAKIKPALDRLGKQLLRQYKGYKTRDGNKGIIGVQFTSLNFNFILDPKKEESRG